MKKYEDFKNSPHFSTIEYIFTDIDDTLTDHGKLHPHAYSALWKLHNNGFKIIPITGRPAGWCEMIARFWPVEAVIGENGGFYFKYDASTKSMKRNYVVDEKLQLENQKKLEVVKKEILSEVSGAKISSDQFCRLLDLAIDFSEDVAPLPEADIQKIVNIFKKHGAEAKISSIHVNGWFGAYDKLSMCKIFCKNELQFELSKNQNLVLFVGDSPNDEPMFHFFENSFAVQNISQFRNKLSHYPQYIMPSSGGKGFSELTQLLIKENEKTFIHLT